MFEATLKRGALASVVLAAGSASADISSVIFTITAEVNSNSYSWDAQLDPGGVDANGNYYWQLANPVEVYDGSDLIFELGSATITIIADPMVSLNFQVLAGQQNTVFTIDSANLSFTPFGGVIGRATAAVSVTDLNGDGATFTPWGPGAYRARYNGASSTFQNLIGAPIVAPAFGSASSSDTFPGVGYAPIPGVISDIESAWRFTLSAGDLASGTSEFEVIPAPASATLLGLGALAAMRRRR